MNKISISRDGRELGQYAPEEIRGLVMTGELVATDSVLHAPTGEWKPLISISEFAPLFGAEPALPAESGGSAAVAGNAPLPPDLPRSPPPLPPPSIPGANGPTAEEQRVIEEIKLWKAQKKRGGCLWICIGCALPLFVIMVVLLVSEVFGNTAGMISFFAGFGGSLVLLLMGVVKMASAVIGLPPGVTPPPGYTNHRSSYSGHSGCSSGSSGGSSGGGCGGGCGG